MVLCGPGCVVCCDFCKYCIHEKTEINGIIRNCEPIGCSLHPDEEHQRKAEHCSSCEDFHCNLAK